MTQHPPQRPLFFDPNLRVVFGVTLMAMLGVASVTPAFPRIVQALSITPQAVGILISAFTLPGVILAPMLGVMADRFGRKIILVPSLLVFGIAGFLCGFARDFELLVALRLLQGIGGAALGAINITLIGDLFDGHRRTAAMGYNAAVLSVGTAVYPAIGGALAMLAWYAPFFLPILAVPVGLVVLLVLRNPEPMVQTQLGQYLRNAWKLMRRGELVMMFVAGVVTFVLIYGAYLSYLPFVLEDRFTATPLGIGLVFAAASLTTSVTSFRLGWLAKRHGEYRLIRMGFVLYVLTLAAIPFASSLWLVVLLVMVFGAANGINIPSILALVSGAAPAEYRAVFMSVNGMLLRLGQTLGPVFAGTAYGLIGLNGAFFVSAGLAAIVGVALAMSGKGEGRREKG
jgi:MFS family permease